MLIAIVRTACFVGIFLLYPFANQCQKLKHGFRNFTVDSYLLFKINVSLNHFDGF